jgi:hypothetical protein
MAAMDPLGSHIFGLNKNQPTFFFPLVSLPCSSLGEIIGPASDYSLPSSMLAHLSIGFFEKECIHIRVTTGYAV